MLRCHLKPVAFLIKAIASIFHLQLDMFYVESIKICMDNFPS